MNATSRRVARSDSNSADEVLVSEEVLVSTDGPVLQVMLNRPTVRNAINLRVAEQVSAALDRLDESPELLVGVVTGSGGTFSAGMDLRAFANGERPTVPGRGFAGITAEPPRKPVIAAVEGYALAGGFEIALACDLIVAAEDAVFGLPEVTRGLVASAGGLLRLPQRLPFHVAMELVLTGARLPAPAAHAHGLVNRLVAPGSALTTAHALAAVIARNGPLAVRTSKEIVVRSRDWPAAEAFARQRALSEPVATSADALEGARAFAEHRPARWTGR